jgi:hypothetical protein
MWIEFTSQNEWTVHHSTYILTALPVRSSSRYQKRKRNFGTKNIDIKAMKYSLKYIKNEQFRTKANRKIQAKHTKLHVIVFEASHYIMLSKLRAQYSILSFHAGASSVYQLLELRYIPSFLARLAFHLCHLRILTFIIRPL